jgi:hypothetical protein
LTLASARLPGLALLGFESFFGKLLNKVLSIASKAIGHERPAGIVARLLSPPVARIALKLQQRDGATAPFEHRVRRWISALGPDNAQLAGRHSDASLSSVTLDAAPRQRAGRELLAR